MFTSGQIELKDTQLIPVYTDPSYTGDIFVEGKTQSVPGKEFYIHQVAYNILKGSDNILVSNQTNKPIDFKQNVAIARASPFVETDTLNLRKLREMPVENLTPLEKKKTSK